MAFGSPFRNEPQRARAGERFGPNASIIGTVNFQDGVIPGRFAQIIDVGGVDTIANMDATATPVIAGVPLRDISGAVESNGTLDPSTYAQASYVNSGHVTVDAVSGDDPTKHQKVFVRNTDDAERGKATTLDDATTEDAGVEFIEDLGGDVWLVYIG